MNNNLEIITKTNVFVFLTYTITILIVSILVFKKNMVSDNK